MIDMKKIKIKDEYIFLFLGAMIVAVGVFGFTDHFYKETAREEKADALEENIPLQCEQGSWIEFPEPADLGQYEKFVGSEKLAYDDKKEIFISADGSRTFSTDENYSLFFFIDRDVQIEGYRMKDNVIFVKKIQCVGAEANKDALQSRRNLMNYIRNNINTLALEKAPKDDWQVATFYFVSDTDLYVQYESEGSFVEEAPYDSRLWLIRATNTSGSVPLLETLAYIVEDAEDATKNIVKQGTDIYRDEKNMTIYEFDEEANQWVLQ